MKVSAHLQPVLAAAVAMAEVTALHGQTWIDPDRRAEMNALRKRTLSGAWTAAKALLDESTAANADTDDDWEAWIPHMVDTPGYQDFLAGFAQDGREDTERLPELWGDLDITDETSGFEVPDKPGIDLRPHVIDLAAPSTRPAELAALRDHARAQMTAYAPFVAGDEVLDPVIAYRFWGGGTLDPLFRAFVANRRRLILPEAPTIGSTTPAPAEVPARPSGATVLRRYADHPRIQPGIVLVEPPRAQDAVTALHVVWLTPSQLRRVVDVEYGPIHYAPPGHPTGRPSSFEEYNSWPVRQVPIYYERYVSVPPGRYEADIPYDGSLASYQQLVNAVVFARNIQESHQVYLYWRNSVGLSEALATSIDRSPPRTSTLAQPRWMMRATTDDEDDDKRQEQLIIVVAAQFATVRTMTVDISENRPSSEGAPWTGPTLTLNRTSPVLFWVPPAAVRARGHSFNVVSSEGHDYTVQAVPDPFPTQVSVG